MEEPETTPPPADDPVRPEEPVEPGPVDSQPVMGPVGWTLASVAVAGLGAGTGLGLLSVSRRDAAKSQCEPGVNDPLCMTDAQDDLDESKSFALGADISFAIGGVAAIGTVVWAVVRSKKQKKAQAAKLQVAPVVDRTQAGVALSGRF